MSILALLAAILAQGCFHAPLIRDCGAVVGNHSGAEEFAWVQPCHRDDKEGCEEKCRPARSACEADYAAWRDKRLWWQGTGGVSDFTARQNLREIEARITRDCPP